MPVAACLAAISSFQAACERDPLVVCAYLGGSFAAGRATEESDVDVYVVALEAHYPTVWARRHDFVEALGEPERLVELPNFEGLGFDLIHFELADGVAGEVAYGHTGNFMQMHGGPYEILLDRIGLLDGVTFPLL